MPRHIQVILRDEVDNLGHAGELVRVRPGYARNYLLPRSLAVVATRGNVKQIEHERVIALKKNEALRAEAQGRADELSKVSVTIEKNSGEGGKLYGSVTSSEVAAALVAAGQTIDRRKIQMPAEAIKTIGSYELGAKLPGGVVGTFKLEVVASETT